MDAVIAQGEASRSDAVSAYSLASSELAAAGGRIGDLRTANRFQASRGETDDQSDNRATAEASANEFFASAADRLDAAIAYVSTEAPEMLGAQAESAKSDIAASIERQKGEISSQIVQARRQARADAALAKREVNAQADSFLEAIESGALAATTVLTEAHTSGMSRIEELETTGLDQVNTIYAEGRTTLAALGGTVGAECTAIGESFATTYEGFANCTENGFWDGDLSQRRARAQANAARETGQAYRDRMVQSARERAREITRNGRKDDRCAVLASAADARRMLDTHYSTLIAGIESARTATVRQTESTRSSILGSIDRSLSATLAQLNQQEHDQRQAADDSGYLQQLVQEHTAHSGAASLQRVVVTAASAVQDALRPLRARFAASGAPDAEALTDALARVNGNIEAAVGTLQERVATGAARLVEQLAGASTQGLVALDGVTSGAIEAVSSIGDGFTAAMSNIAGTDNFASQRQALEQMLEQSSTGGSAALGRIAEGVAESNTRITEAARVSLARAGVDLEANLRRGKEGIACDITSKADEAASHEPPAWKQLVAVLLVILVIVIIIAVIVLTAGMALGPIATIAVGVAIGAVVGAVTSGLLAIAGNLWSNRRWTTGVVDAIIVGAIAGAAGGFLGAAAGLLAKGASVAIQLGAQMLAAGLVDAATQLITSDFSLENFSFARLGFTLLVTALTFGFASRVSAGKVGFANRIRAGLGLRNLAPPPPPTPAGVALVGNHTEFHGIPVDRLPANLPPGHSWSRTPQGEWVIVRGPGAPPANLELTVYADANGNVNFVLRNGNQMIAADAVTRQGGNYTSNTRLPQSLSGTGANNPYVEQVPPGGTPETLGKGHGVDFADTLEGPGVRNSSTDPANFTPQNRAWNEGPRNALVGRIRAAGGGYRELPVYASSPRVTVDGTPVPDAYIFVETTRAGVPIRAWRIPNTAGAVTRSLVSINPYQIPVTSVPPAMLTQTPVAVTPGTPYVPYVVYGVRGDDEPAD